jgi:hypothetical protein
MAIGRLLMLLAMLPQLAYFDHWLADFAEPEAAASSSGREEEGSHRDHCHIGLATCSDQPAPPGLRGFATLVDLPDPDLPTVLVQHNDAKLDEFLTAPPKPPPRAGARAMRR